MCNSLQAIFARAGVLPSATVTPNGSKGVCAITNANAQASSISEPISVSRITFVLLAWAARPAPLSRTPANMIAAQTARYNAHFLISDSSIAQAVQLKPVDVTWTPFATRSAPHPDRHAAR